MIFLLIIVVIAIAFFTKPNKDSFFDYVQKGQSFSSAPIIEEKDYFLYKQFTITFFDQLPAVDSTGKSKNVAVSSDKETFLGLFGKFWKMD